MIEIEVPNYVSARLIPCRFIGVVIEQVLKAVLPDEDFSVFVNYEGLKKLVIHWEAVN